MRRILFLFCMVLLLSAACSAVFGAAGDEPEQTRQTVFEILNSLRIKYGCGELKFDDHLNSAAQRQAEYLAEIGRLETAGPAGESVHERAADAGYGGDKEFTAKETNAQVWMDTDADYLVEQVWRKSQPSVRVIFDPSVRQIGIGIADAPDKHRYYVLTLAGLKDGTDDYAMTRPTYDYRTPKPTVSATPSPQPLVTSTRSPDGGVWHVVQEGETFSEIALAYGLDWYTLSVRNNIKLSDTTPVVIMEGQVLAIEPTYTMTPTPTATKTPLPPTHTPRPTFTAGPAGGNSVSPSLERLPAPDWDSLLNKTLPWKKTVGLILVILCAPGFVLSLRKKK